MSAPKQTILSIQADFDRIALIRSQPWDHNIQYHSYLADHIPVRSQLALEIGCGTGTFSRILASRAERVLAIDLSPQMVHQARRSSREYSNIEFVIGDVMERGFLDDEFDCIASLTTLHHLPLEATLEKIKRTLRPGGTFVCLDLYQRSTMGDWLFDAIAYPLTCCSV